MSDSQLSVTYQRNGWKFIQIYIDFSFLNPIRISMEDYAPSYPVQIAFGFIENEIFDTFS